ncbi:MAG: NAD(P)-binding domain-containing protein [Calditrichia bacterium]
MTTENGERHTFAGIIIANGTLAEPKIPQIPGNFSGEIFHSSKYKSPKIFEGKRVLIVGAGNSGCDIAVDAVYHAKSVAISVRRGYHFIAEIRARQTGGYDGRKLFKLPPRLKQMADGFILKFFTGDPEKFGFPKPDHRIYESHPIVNSLVLYHWARRYFCKVRYYRA